MQNQIQIMLMCTYILGLTTCFILQKLIHHKTHS